MADITIDDNLLRELTQLSRTAGEAIMHVYQLDDFGVEEKTDDSPVTKADNAANDLICNWLAEHYPAIPIISEEYPLPAYEERRSWTYCWIVDPLDGTKEFIKKNGEFTTNIALVKNGQPIVGVVYLPVKDLMYAAATGVGAYKEAGGRQTPLQARTYDPAAPGLSLVCSRSHMGARTQAYTERYSQPIMLKVGSSLKMMLIAEGKADIYPKLGPISEWDVAASQCILTEAGGSITHIESGLPIHYNKESMLMPHFLAEGIRKQN